MNIGYIWVSSPFLRTKSKAIKYDQYIFHYRLHSIQEVVGNKEIKKLKRKINESTYIFDTKKKLLSEIFKETIFLL